MNTKFLTGLALAGAMAMSGCTQDRVANGALIGAGAGAVVSGALGGSVLAGAAVGAAGGAVIGAVTRHNDGTCYRRDRDGYEHRVDCN